MSAKWVRSKQWDDEFFPAWAWPAKFLLRAFSSIALSASLLSMVAVFGILASIPVGMIASIPTYLIYLLSLLATIALVAILPTWLVGRALRSSGRGVRFTMQLAMVVALGTAAFFAWKSFAWPHLKYHVEIENGQMVPYGLMFFSDFVEQYKSIPLRRLPGMEMSELEFYAWWPLELILFLFIANLTIATLRRIEFKFANLGVLTVHTGIITIALGSVYYAALKKEGDVLLVSGELDAEGLPTPGRPEPGFFDNTHTVLWLNQGKGWEQRALRGLPRYNDYALHVLGEPASNVDEPSPDGGRTLSVPVADESPRRFIDPDISFRVVGYANYAGLEQRWRPVDQPVAADEPRPIRVIELHSTLAPDGSVAADAQVAAFPLVPDSPPDRVMLIGEFVGVELTRGLDDASWARLATPLAPGVQHALHIEVQDAMVRQTVPITAGEKFEVGGFGLEVIGLDPMPQLPIITKGYENAMTSVTRIKVTPPKAADGSQPTPFTRHIYARFPEISQDLLDELNERGMPKRRGADSSIKITYLDASMVQVHLDERPAPAGEEPPVRGIVRFPGGDVKTFEDLRIGSTIPFGDRVSLKLGKRWSHAERVEVPVVVPEKQRDRDSVGNHKKAVVAVELTLRSTQQLGGPPIWQRTLWIPFAHYLDIGRDFHRVVTLPDGRPITVAFGRRWHSFPDMALQLLDFEMKPYPHSMQPQDFRSDVRVIKGATSGGEMRTEDRYTSLNDPLLIGVDFLPNPEVGAVGNTVGRLASLIAPNQYKFSQNGWDPSTWNDTKAAAERGELKRAYARFTILGVGNNPGIGVIATGSVLMSLGIPWAFYVKPLIVRRQKRRIQANLAAQAAAKAGQPANAATSSVSPVVTTRSNHHAAAGMTPETTR